MILFYHKKTGEILGTIEGRVHFPEHLKSSISRSDVLDSDIGRHIIGWEEKEDGTSIKHNMHHWHHQLTLEDPKNKLRYGKKKMKLDSEGNVLDIEIKSK